MTKATNAANYIFWLEQLHPQITETHENHKNGPDGFKSLALDKVQFSYPMRPHTRVLRGVDLEVCHSYTPSFSLVYEAYCELTRGA